MPDCYCSKGPLGPHDDWPYHSPRGCGRTLAKYRNARETWREMYDD